MGSNLREHDRIVPRSTLWSDWVWNNDNKTDRTVLPIAKDRQEPSGNGSEKGDELNLRFKAPNFAERCRAGYVFKVIWTEPRSDQLATSNKVCEIIKGDRAYSEIHRFLFVGREISHSLCLWVFHISALIVRRPILTYGNQATNKNGFLEDHVTKSGMSTLVFTGRQRYADNSHDPRHNGDYGDGELSQSAHMHGGPNIDCESGELKEHNCKCDNDQAGKAMGKIKHSLPKLAIINSSASILMALSFLPLNENMDLIPSSPALTSVVSTTGFLLPQKIMVYLERFQSPNFALFSIFTIATVIFTCSVFAWAKTKTRTASSKLVFGALALMGTSVCGFVGFTPEELFLVCLPTCISITMTGSCLCRHGKSVQ